MFDRFAKGVFTGLIIGTMFTLFVVPMFYTFIASKNVKRIVDEDGNDPALVEPAH